MEIGTGTGDTGGGTTRRRIEAPTPDALSAEGPLVQALTELWEKARKAKHKSLEKLVIRFYEAAATWQVHQALATMTREAQVACRFETSITADGVETFQIVLRRPVSTRPTRSRASSTLSYVPPPNTTSRRTYTLTFPSGLLARRDKPEAFAKNLTRYGSGEAYVEATRPPTGGPS